MCTRLILVSIPFGSYMRGAPFCRYGSRRPSTSWWAMCERSRYNVKRCTWLRAVYGHILHWLRAHVRLVFETPMSGCFSNNSLLDALSSGIFSARRMSKHTMSVVGFRAHENRSGRMADLAWQEQWYCRASLNSISIWLYIFSMSVWKIGMYLSSQVQSIYFLSAYLEVRTWRFGIIWKIWIDKFRQCLCVYSRNVVITNSSIFLMMIAGQREGENKHKESGKKNIRSTLAILKHCVRIIVSSGTTREYINIQAQTLYLVFARSEHQTRDDR